METEKKLPWYLRIMYLLPIFLCVTITVVAVIKYTRTSYTGISDLPASTTEPDLREETERGKEILEQQQVQNEGES